MLDVALLRMLLDPVVAQQSILMDRCGLFLSRSLGLGLPHVRGAVGHIE